MYDDACQKILKYLNPSSAGFAKWTRPTLNFEESIISLRDIWLKLLS